MLDLYSRGAIVGLSALCVSGVLVLAPSRARSAFDDTALRLASVIAAAPVSGGAIEPLRRDPFAQPQPSEQPAPAVALPARSAQPGLEPLPNNLPTDAIPTLPGMQPDASARDAHVTAIVSGAHAYAMLEIGGVHEIKGIGDLVGGVPIVSINLAGVRLQNGVLLTVAAAGQP